MMRALAILFGSAILCGLVVAGMPARADEKNVPLDKVPKAVMDAVKSKYPDAKVRTAATEKEEGKTVYEISLTYKNHNYDVTFTPEGKIVDVEKEIDAKELPKVVAKALRTKYPKATFKIVEELSKGDDKVSGYEVLLVTAEKKTFEVELDTKGKIVKETEKTEKKPGEKSKEDK
jgi:uncharacterized membrane protein YkoI